MGYIIEKREKGRPNWTKAAELHSPYCKGSAENLEEGTEYEFRVKAVNEAGPGEPSQPSQSIVTKPRKCNQINYATRYVPKNLNTKINRVNDFT